MSLSPLCFTDNHVHVERFAPHGHESTRMLFELHRQKGVKDLSILSYMPGCDLVSNLNVLWWKTHYKEIRLRAFGCFHEADCYAHVPYLEQYRHLMSLGCDGVKFIQMKPDRRKPLGKGLNHPSYDEAFSQMEKDGTPVVIHSGDPQEFWDRSKVDDYAIKQGWFYGDGSFPSAEQLYREIFEMLQKHPKLNVTFAHFFFLSGDIAEARRVMETYPNVKFDLTPGGEMFVGFAAHIDAWQDFFETYSHRILFGTDTCDAKHPKVNEALIDSVREVLSHEKTAYTMPIYGGYPVKGLGLSEKAVENICYGNYQSTVGTSVKEGNKALLLKTAEQMLLDCQNDPQHQESARWLRWLLA